MTGQPCPRTRQRPSSRAPSAACERGATIGRFGGRAIMGYHLEAQMTDMLIRDVPEEVIAVLDAHAARLGLSRSEYVRRRLAQDAATPGSPVSVEDLARFADTFADLADPDVMSQAWT
jgi:plasmid stability protein